MRQQRQQSRPATPLARVVSPDKHVALIDNSLAYALSRWALFGFLARLTTSTSSKSDRVGRFLEVLHGGVTAWRPMSACSNVPKPGDGLEDLHGHYRFCRAVSSDLWDYDTTQTRRRRRQTGTKCARANPALAKKRPISPSAGQFLWLAWHLAISTFTLYGGRNTVALG